MTPDRGVSRITRSKIITLSIILLIMVFAVLIALTALSSRMGTPAVQSGAPAGGTGGPPGPQGPPQARSAAAVRAAVIARGDIENHVVINGDVLARTQVILYPTVAGRLTQTRLQVGDRAVQGQTVALVDPSRPGELYSLSPVVSTVPGTVLAAPANPGDMVSPQSAIYVVGDLSALMLETFVPERFATQVHRRLPAQVRFEAMPGEGFPALVDEVSPVLDSASRTLRIRLVFSPGPSGRPDPRIKAGMFATLSLAIASRRDVPLVPREAVINTYGSSIVFVVRDDMTAERREITTGLEDEAYFEVLDGLAAGERVVSAGQNFLSQGDTLRIVE